MIKVLVVGGAGYIGGAVTEVLLKKGISFTVYDNLTYENHYLKPVHFIKGDVRDHEKLAKLLSKYTHVIWLAAIVGDAACAINEELTAEINQESVAWLSKNYDGRILFTSTCSVYGAQEMPVNEESPVNPLSAYAKTKLAAESFLRDKNSLIFRLGTAYGIPDTYSRLRMDLAVNYMTMTAVTRKKLTVFGGNQWRPFIHVSDIGRFLVDNLESSKTGIYNIATENETIINLAKRIKKQIDCDIEITEQKFEDNRSYNALTDKALKEGIIPSSTKNNIDYGIKQVKTIIEEGRVNNLSYEMYSNERRMLEIISEYQSNGY